MVVIPRTGTYKELSSCVWISSSVRSESASSLDTELLDELQIDTEFIEGRKHLPKSRDCIARVLWWVS